MTILTRILSNGQKILLSNRGNQSLMQILDSADNVIFTRCKSIKRITVPVNTLVERRTSIGFVPQQLKSHTNDLTRRQIGFLPANTNPVRYKTNAPRDKYSIITKSDFDSNMETSNISAVVRKQSSKGKITTTQMRLTDDILALNAEQSSILKQTASEHANTLEGLQNTLAQAEEYVKVLENRGTQLQQEHARTLELTAQIDNELNETFTKGLRNEEYAAFGHKKAPNVVNADIMQFVNGLTATFSSVRDTICSKIAALQNSRRKVTNLCSSLETQINEHSEMMKSIDKKLDVCRNNVKMVKGHLTAAEAETRQQVCAIQRQISSLVAKQV